MENALLRKLELGGLRFDIVVGGGEGDPICEQIRQGVFAFPSHFQLLFALMQPGARVLDLGAHVGTFALAAAALGCQVVAVEASPHNVALLNMSVAQNGFDRMRVLEAAVTDHPGFLDFVQGGPFGAVANPAMQSPSIQVLAVTVDDVLAAVGWEQVDLIKVDVEGSEVAATRGMSRLLARADAPMVLFESNGHTLGRFGETPQTLRAAFERFGYRNYLIEPGKLVPVSTSELQPEGNADYLAVKKMPPLPPGWRIGAPMNQRDLVRKILSTSSDPNECYRAHLARALATANPAILAHKEVRRALDTLCTDPVEEVRLAASWWADGRTTKQPPIQPLQGQSRPGIAHRQTPGSSQTFTDEGRSGPVTSQDPDAAFQIEGTDIDAEAIMQEIRARLRARRDEARARGLDWEAYADGLYPVPSNAVLGRDLYEAVRHLSLAHDKANVDMMLTETQVPLIGGLIQRLRTALHELVLFYVNRLAARQARVNYQTSRAITLLLRDLEAEVRELRARVESLEHEQKENT